MSDLTPVGILLLIMLIMTSLQLVPGIFILFSHAKLGQFSKTKASDLSTFFILGTETAVILFSLAIYAILNISPLVASFLNTPCFSWLLAGIFLALGILFCAIYYRKSPGTELFISRNFAARCQEKISLAKTRSDAFLLGLFAGLPELVFTFPLYLLASLTVMNFATTAVERAIFTLLFAFSAVLPLLVCHFLFSTHHTLADLIRFRFKNKTFFRFFITFCYFLIAILIILGVLL